MEFWGIEVKPKESVKCDAEPEKLLHLSQASLGEIKKDKKIENVPVFVKVNDQKLVLGTLSSENCAQIQYDLVFEKEFELSHGSKDASVFFVGYKSSHTDHGSEDDLSDFDSDEDVELGSKVIEKAAVKNNEGKPATGKVVIGKDSDVNAKTKPQTGKPDKVEKPKSDGSLNKIVGGGDDDDDEESDDEESEDDDEPLDLPKGIIDSDDDEDDSSDDEEANLKKSENDKKRSADGVLKPAAGKKAKFITPIEKQKTGDAKKGSKAAVTPPSLAKQAKKTPEAKAKQPTGAFKCNSCNKPFNSDNALQAHTKAKHSAGK